MRAILVFTLLFGTVTANASPLICSLMLVQQFGPDSSGRLEVPATTDSRNSKNLRAVLSLSPSSNVGFESFELRIQPLEAGEFRFDIVGINGSNEKSILGLITHPSTLRLQNWANLKDDVAVGVRCN